MVSTPLQTMVRVYRKVATYEADASALAEQGWSVGRVVERKRFWQFRPRLEVTYQRTRRDAQTYPADVETLLAKPGRCWNCRSEIAPAASVCPSCGATVKRDNL